MAVNKGYERRRIYFIDRKFQTRFILKFCILVLIGSLISMAILYFLTTQSKTVSIINSRVVVRTTADFLLPLLFQTMAIATIIIGAATIWVTLFVSHKISGPLYHFKKAMKTLEDGDFSSSFNLRQLDQLQDLSDTFNNMINKLRKQLNIIKNDFGTLKIRLDALSENDVSEYKRHLLKALKNLLQDLSKAIDYFKS